MIKKNRCGIKGLEFNGSRVEIGTPSSSMEQPHKGYERILSKDLGTMVEFGRQRRE